MRTITLFLLSISFFFIGQCKPENAEYLKLAGFTQGTTYHITYKNTVGENLST
ncbi:MAG: hypothetical protein HC906_03600 [Bacteroidales bacterium]|nr:hypothetical protein [Bacteroidales bacterium]